MFHWVVDKELNWIQSAGIDSASGLILLHLNAATWSQNRKIKGNMIHLWDIRRIKEKFDIIHINSQLFLELSIIFHDLSLKIFSKCLFLVSKVQPRSWTFHHEVNSLKQILRWVSVSEVKSESWKLVTLTSPGKLTCWGGSCDMMESSRTSQVDRELRLIGGLRHLEFLRWSQIRLSSSGDTWPQVSWYC